MKKTVATFALMLMGGAAHGQTSQTFGAFMAGLASATTPLSSSDVLYVLQGSNSRQITKNNLFTTGISGFTVDVNGNVNALSLSTTATNTSTANPYVFNVITNTDGVNGGAVGFKINHGITTGAVGNHIGFESILGINTAPTTAGEYVGVWPFVYANVNAGGSGSTAQTSKGAAVADNPQVQLTASATFWDEAAGMEVDVEVDSGASVYARFGINITTIGSDAVKGSSFDAALAIGSTTGSPGWTNGIQFTNWNGGDPLKAGSTAIGVATAMSVAHGVDFSNFTCSSDCFKSVGFSVNGTGNVTVAAGSKTAPALTFTGNTGVGLYSRAADYLSFASNSIEMGLWNPNLGIFASRGISLAAAANDWSTGAADTGIFRNAAGVVEINNATATAYRDLIVRGLQLGTYVAVASLPTCNGTTDGMWRNVNDATAPTYNAALTGLGTVHVPVYCDGTSWKSH